MPAAPPPGYLTAREVALRFRCCPKTVGNWIREGRTLPDDTVVFLQATRIGRPWLIHPDDLARFEHRVRPPEVRPALDAAADEDTENGS